VKDATDLTGRIFRIAGLLLGIFFSISPNLSLSQAPPTIPATQVSEEFWRLETNGERLKSSGMEKVGALFARPVPAPSVQLIHVVGDPSHDTIEETTEAEGWTEVSVTTNELGTLDRTLRFARSPRKGRNNVALLRGPVITLDLVLTTKRLKLREDGTHVVEATSTPKWLILCGSESLWVSVDTAIRYVTEMRARTKDPNMRKNADQSLANLRSLQKRILQK